MKESFKFIDNDGSGYNLSKIINVIKKESENLKRTKVYVCSKYEYNDSHTSRKSSEYGIIFNPIREISIWDDVEEEAFTEITFNTCDGIEENIKTMTVAKMLKTLENIYNAAEKKYPKYVESYEKAKERVKKEGRDWKDALEPFSKLGFELNFEMLHECYQDIYLLTNDHTFVFCEKSIAPLVCKILNIK
jgi:hypothetical protein